jgi:cytochrome c oxidase subunit I+III
VTGVAEERLAEAWSEPPGVRGKLRGVSNNWIGPLYIAAAFGFFVVAGMDSVALRTQLAAPDAGFISADTFNQLFTTHGTAMMFLVTVPVLEAITIYALPMVLGTRDMCFPRMSAFSFWTYVFGGVLFYASTLPDIGNFLLPGSPLPNLVPNAGWFAYPPLTNREFSPGLNIDFYLLGLGFAEFAGVSAAIEIIVTVLKMRAPGMTFDRIPLFAWSVLVMAFTILLAFPAVIVGTTLLELERKFGMPFFDPKYGGDPLLWQHVFWIFGHPEVYIMLIPATGIVSTIIPTFTNRPIAGYLFVATAIAATGVFSFGLWVHHMFTTGLPLLQLTLFGAASMMITFPSGVQVFAWLATLLNAPRLRFDVPMLYALGFIVTFVFGGITGVMVAAVPFDWQVHDTHFVTAHFHYVLVGGVIFPILGAFVYWWPKVSGRLMDERLGRSAFWLIFIGFNVTFLPMHLTGLLGMPRRVYTYSPELGVEGLNLVSTLGTYLSVVGFGLFAAIAITSVWRGREAGPDPWRAIGLEWTIPSPAPPYMFGAIPEITERHPTAGSMPRLWRPHRVREMSARGHLWRETLVTSTFDAHPQAIQVLAGLSYVPLALGVTLTVVSAALLFELYAIAVIFTVLSAPLVVAWLWPSREEREYPNVGATLDGADLPVHTTGTAALGWWGMVFGLVAVAAGHLIAIFSFVYLVYAGPAPVEQVRAPFGPAGVTTALAVTAAMAAARASRAIRDGEQARLRIWLFAVVTLFAAAATILVLDLLSLGLRPQTSAYDAIFVTLAGYQIGLVTTAAAGALLILAQAIAGHFTRARRLGVQNVAVLAAFAAGSHVVTVVLLYVLPWLP